MKYKSKTVSEINIEHIERTLKKLKKGLISVRNCGLNKRFERLKSTNPYLCEELYAKYVQIVKNLPKINEN